MFRRRLSTTTSTLTSTTSTLTSTTYEDLSSTTYEEEEGFTSATYEEEDFPTQENITFPQTYGLVEKHDIEVIDIWKYFFTLEQKWFVVN